MTYFRRLATSSIERKIAVLEPASIPRVEFSQLMNIRSTLYEILDNTEFLEKFILPSDSYSKSSEVLHRVLGWAKDPLGTVFSYQPPMPFSRGAIEDNKKLNPDLIEYLLQESDEVLEREYVPELIQYAKQFLSCKGKLKQTKKGMVYIDIDNEFIHTLTLFLRGENLIKPPYFNAFSSPQGAHAIVMTENEVKYREVFSVLELGQEFTFQIEGVYTVNPDSWGHVKKAWILQIRSPQLEALREKYRLPAKVKGHDFQITLALKPLEEGDIKKKPPMRINVAFIAA